MTESGLVFIYAVVIAALAVWLCILTICCVEARGRRRDRMTRAQWRRLSEAFTAELEAISTMPLSIPRFPSATRQGKPISSASLNLKPGRSGRSSKRTSSPACRAWAPLVSCCISVDLGEHFWSLLGASVLSIPSVTSWISDDLGEHFWSLLAPSLLSIPLVTSWISVDLGEHFWSLLGLPVLSIPLGTS